MRPERGSVIVVAGAVGGVGRAAVFAARALGAKVWAGVRGSQKQAAVKLGVDGVVALDSDGEIAALPMLDAIADTIGGPTIGRLLSRLKPGGVVASVVEEPAGAEGADREQQLEADGELGERPQLHIGGAAIARPPASFRAERPRQPAGPESE